jgi:hypothetical protein
MKMRFALLCKSPETNAAWLARYAAEAAGLRKLTTDNPDVALYIMLQTAINDVDHYSAHHAMFCATVADLCSQWLDCPAGERDSLFNAALTMNLAMTVAQDEMAKQSSALSAEQRRRVVEHPAASAALLKAAGVDDGLWLEIVRGHHPPAGSVADGASASQRLSGLLHRIDVFAAKLSRRKARAASTAALAARDAYLDATGLPDAIGATMLRVLGLYPPGSFVRLANREVAVVTRRGEKTHTPIVVGIRRANGFPFSNPPRRDTSDPAYQIQRGLLAGDVKMVLNHQQILSA